MKGFTLLEVVIATTILAFLSIYTGQTIQRALKSKAKIQKEIDQASQLRDALQIINRDIRSAFNYRDIRVDLYNQAYEQRIERAKKKEGGGATPPKPGTSVPTPPPSSTQQGSAKKLSQILQEEYKPKKQVIVTEFNGEAKVLHFTTLSNIRSQQDSLSSDQAEVGYYLKSCRNRVNKSARSQCLWRRSSTVLDDKVNEGGSDVVLIENVAEFELRYLGPGKEDNWVETWKSGEDGDAVTKQKFPYAVEVTLGIKNKTNEKAKPITMTMVAQLRFPNNIEQTNNANDPTQAAGGAQ